MNAKPKSESYSFASDADWAMLRESAEADYDGHTGFSKMSASDRLHWLEQAAEFVWRHNAARQSPSVPES